MQGNKYFIPCFLYLSGIFINFVPDMRKMNPAVTSFLSLASALVLSLQTVAAYDGPGGLAFRSYESAPDVRTSISVPSEEYAGFGFSRELRIRFDNRIDASRENFGYICRIIVDGVSSVDIILVNHVDALPQIGIVANCSESPEFFPLVDAIYEWHTMDIRFVCDDSGLALYANGTGLGHVQAARRRHEARLLFGANDCGQFSTTDAAPAIIDNIRVSEDGCRHEHVWNFTFSESSEIPDSAGIVSASLTNPGWVLERNLKWSRVGEIVSPSKVFVVTDYRNSVWLVGEDRMTRVTLPSFKTEETVFRSHVNVSMLTNNFIVLPGDRIAYYDFVPGRSPLVMFDESRGDWDRPITRERHSPYLHHNVFYNMLDTSVVQMFGYGYHNYSDDMYVCNVQGGDFYRSRIDEISPRYLSAVGVRDSIAYIYGGKGNDGGNQELGAVVTNDFWMMNIRDYTVRKVWENPADSASLAAWNLIISRDGTKFRGLVYSPNTFRTSLQLTEFSVADGTSSHLGDRIPYFFLDTDSDARLLYDEINSSMYAVTIHKDEDDRYVASFWSIRCPVLSRADFTGAPDEDATGLWRWVAVCGTVLLLACMAAGVAVSARRRRHKDEEPAAETSDVSGSVAEDTGTPGIFLIGGFRVTSAGNKDITSSFSQQLRQLLCLLILYTESKGGISSGELKDALWFDKSDDSYRNNRGVYFRRLRLLLEPVSPGLRIQSDNGLWRIECDEAMCDYFRNMRILDDSSCGGDKVSGLVAVARQGTLLPDIQAEWLDPFKSLYDSRILEKLCEFRDNPAIMGNPKRLIEIADAILGFDSLDEVTVKAKCKALMELRKFGLAKEVFDKFSKEYAALMGEEYSQQFTDFVK